MKGVREMKLRKTLVTLIESGLSSVTLLIFHCKREVILSVRHGLLTLEIDQKNIQ